ncbi:methionine/alanine import family NSS transporter small subunit [Oerskovia flava]|uniref:methionine/alanine import family NSS transporter small subunit n=1 Tax=Oerskovia flava TaxID=2986422 RepID=UPI00223F020C|nr:methionine/alanine import family NSS transporter small subunit [Oerskovia sp. JB1-3-2]
MTGEATIFLVLAIVIVWGGLLASILFLRSRPDSDSIPEGGEDDHREDDAPVERDT